MKEKRKIQINVNDIIGKRFGKLEVISYEGYKYELTSGGERLRHFYNVRCDCGTIKLPRRGNLVGGKTKSCRRCLGQKKNDRL